MYACYLIALIPVLFGAGMWALNKKIALWEWAISAAAGFAAAGVFHLIAISWLTADTETWSGQVYQVVDYPRWEARWTTTETYYTGTGKNRTAHTRIVRHHEVHPQHWTAKDTLQQERDISRDAYLDFHKRLGGIVRKEKPSKEHFDCGDPYTYHTDNTSKELIPCTAIRAFENRVKASRNLFKFTEVPKGVPVHPYPSNADPYHSNRLIGITGTSLLEWDKLNSRLGPTKKVNLILIGFGKQEESIAQYQESAWLRGRKNDLVLCLGGDPSKPDWSYVFGWTESELVKRNLATTLLEKGVDIPAIEKEVRENYSLKDWSKFDYLSVEVPWYYYMWLMIIMAITQGGYWTWAHFNGLDKRSEKKKGNSRWKAGD